jgi:branched-chain amino acid transport system ATP-binding protein
MAILDVEDIHTYYGESYVLQGLSLSLEDGRILGVLGRNGVGKTTLVNSILGFAPPRSGAIRFKGEDITRLPSHAIVRRGIGLVPQGRRVFGSLSVEENLAVAAGGAARRGWTAERVFGLFERLRERRRQQARTLSGGEQQMLAIGRGLMTNPDCLVMDEPTEGLAPLIVQQVWESIARLKAEGLAILLVEQNVTMALRLVDRVCVVSKGRVVHASAPEALSVNEAVKSQYLGV